MKKKTLAIVCMFLFNLTLTSCNLMKKEIKQTETDSSQNSIPKNEQVEEIVTEEVILDPSNDQGENEVKPVSKEELQEVSYAFGCLLVKQLQKVENDIEFDLTYVIQGMEAAIRGEVSPLSEEEYSNKLHSLYEANFLYISAKNLEQAKHFLDKNKNEKDVIVLVEDKLQYKILQEGNGEVIDENSELLVYFKGELLDGRVFGSSEHSSEPTSVIIQKMIPGIADGIKGMKLGEKRIIYIHPDLGYGTMMNIPIPPNSLLIFEVEVVSFSKTTSEVMNNLEQGKQSVVTNLEESLSTLDKDELDKIVN